MNVRLCGIKSGYKFLSFCHNSHRLIDRRTDRRTDRQTEKPSQYRALHYMQSHGKNHWPQGPTWTVSSNDDGVLIQN